MFRKLALDVLHGFIKQTLYVFHVHIIAKLVNLMQQQDNHHAPNASQILYLILQLLNVL